jgi:predicted acetyltransferase
MNVKIHTTEWVTPMGRVLDVTQLDGMQIGEGRFTVQINDPFCAWNNGIFAFESFNGRLNVVPAYQADCELNINGLSALIYGTHNPAEFALRGWGRVNPQIQIVMNRMFPMMLPHMHAPY